MAVTMQQIADLVGVSRGTVDRALNNRGRIRPEVAEKIREVAKELGYHPNIAAKALSTARQPLKIGVIIQYAETHFMKRVLEGCNNAIDAVGRLGGEVFIHTISGEDVKDVLNAMRSFQEIGVKGIVLVPTHDELLRREVNRLVEKGIEIITVNSDLEGTKRRCFIGQDNYAAGRVAGGLMGEIILPGSEVMVISGAKKNVATIERTKGFMDELRREYPSVQILEPRYAYDDDWVAGKLLEEQLEKNSNLRGIYLTAQGERGVCEVLKKYGKAGEIKVIAHDYEGDNKKNLRDGTIHFILRQNAYVQGYESIMELFHGLCGNPTHKESFWYTDIVIKTKCNI